MAEPIVAVIIPFYQKEHGILRRAVQSALTQADVALPRVVVVDDGSPLDARAELSDLLRQFPRNVEVIRQENAGPAAARNRGLRHVVADADIVAFLDSDDAWAPQHLRIAQTALKRGFNFYFCDAVHRDGKRTVFESQSFPDRCGEPLAPEGSLYAYRGDFFQLVLDRCPVHTSAVVYRPRSLPFLFQEELRVAGEDYAFWLRVGYCETPVAYSTCPNVNLGTGVNIYAGVDWATNSRIKQLYFNQLFVSRLPRRYALTGQRRLSYQRLRQDHRRAFTENVCSMLAHGRGFEYDLLLKFAVIDPLVMLQLPSYLAWRLAARSRDAVIAKWRV